MSNKTQIKSTDWLIRGYSAKELEQRKVAAIKEAETELQKLHAEGHWEIDDANLPTQHYHCPRCGCYEKSPRNFCPDCGLIMKGVKVYDQM